jgi:broad specificity phosphatase PhoE
MSTDYDQLSDQGIAQSRQLGESWAERGFALDAIYIGPHKRHAQTAEHVRAAAKTKGLSLPEAQMLDGGGEIKLQSLFAEAFKRVGPMFPDLVQHAQSEPSNKEGMGHVMGMVAKMMERWSLGDHPTEGLEPFADFATRVNKALFTLMREQGRGKSVGYFSSGGPIAQAVRLALSLSPEKTIQVMVALENSSVTELRYTEDKLGLISLNAVGHLPQAMRTRV